ncbi:hypothetical protein MMC31_001782 [Peltigera leucophlebia]|nr:hypothetical protein [Peltigera leucophlebia]
MLLGHLHVLLLAQYASALAQKPLDPQIEQAVAECKRREQPQGGCFVPMPTREGGWDCVVCIGSSYIHPKTGLSACCGIGTSWTTDPVHILEGKCCPADKMFRFDAAVGKGDCVDEKIPLAPAEMAPPTSTSTTEGSGATTNNSCLDCPKPPGACPADGTLPIRYGRCYTVSNLAGSPLARSSLYYYSGGILGEYKELVFKICNSTTNCNIRSGEYVPKGGSWYQLDRDFTSAESSWVGSSSIWLARVNIASASNLIANFVAKPICLFGQCALCLRVAKDVGTNGANHGLSLYAVTNEAIQFIGNPVSCYPVVYQESDCLDSSIPA